MRYPRRTMSFVPCDDQLIFALDCGLDRSVFPERTHQLTMVLRRGAAPQSISRRPFRDGAQRSHGAVSRSSFCLRAYWVGGHLDDIFQQRSRSRYRKREERGMAKVLENRDQLTGFHAVIGDEGP